MTGAEGVRAWSCKTPAKVWGEADKDTVITIMRKRSSGLVLIFGRSLLVICTPTHP